MKKPKGLQRGGDSIFLVRIGPITTKQEGAGFAPVEHHEITVDLITETGEFLSGIQKESSKLHNAQGHTTAQIRAYAAINLVSKALLEALRREEEKKEAGHANA